MSEPIETFDQRYEEFRDSLHTLLCPFPDGNREWVRIMDIAKIKPKIVARYLKAVYGIMELKASIDFEILRAKSQETENLSANEVARIEQNHKAFHELFDMWDGVLAACDSIEELPEMIRGYYERNNNRLFRRSISN